MNELRKFFKHWDEVSNITIKLMKQIPEGKLDFKATPKSMTIRDLMSHIYHAEKVFAETLKGGEMKMEDFDRFPVPEIKTVEDLCNWAKEVHENTNRILSEMSDEEIMKNMIRTPWGELSVFEHINSAYEHLWHHRGQLYVYLRMLGVDNPVFVFSYEGVPETV